MKQDITTNILSIYGNVGQTVLDRLFCKLDKLPFAPMCCLGNSDLLEQADPEWTQCTRQVTQLFVEHGIDTVLLHNDICPDVIKGIAEPSDDQSSFMHECSQLTLICLYEKRNAKMEIWDGGQSLPKWKNTCPSIASEIDDEGLLLLPRNFDIQKRAFICGGTAIPPCRHLATRHSEQPDTDLLLKLYEISCCDHIVVRIAPNYRLACKASDYGPPLTEDYWFGKPLKPRHIDDLNWLGTTVHGAPATPDVNKHYWAMCQINGLARTEFRWSRKSGESSKTFEAEEVKNICSDPGRFIHAIRDCDNKVFTHMDGAIMHYSVADHAKRIDPSCKLPSTPRANPKPKIFRIDGKFDIDTFALISCLFFRGNLLIHEYFEEFDRPNII